MSLTLSAQSTAGFAFVYWPPVSTSAVVSPAEDSYRLGRGRLLGHRGLYLAHTGRTSGRRRETILEVIGYDPRAPQAVVVAAWGSRSDWFQNIQASPPLEIRIAGESWPRPHHRVLDDQETLSVLTTYRTRHPRAWRRIAPLLGFPLNLDTPAERERLRGIRAVAFRPRR